MGALYASIYDAGTWAKMQGGAYVRGGRIRRILRPRIISHKLVWPANPLSPLQNIILSFIVKGDGKLWIGEGSESGGGSLARQPLLLKEGERVW